MKEAKFQLFRYQILPINRHIQGDLLDGFPTIEKLLAAKNSFFSDALLSIKSFSTSDHDIHTQLLSKDNNFYLYRVAVKKKNYRETINFTREEMDTWPSFYMGFWNDPAHQFLIIGKRSVAFHEPRTMANIAINKVNEYLVNKNLTVVFEPLFEKNTFWNIIEKYENSIEKISFSIITPNMANLSKTLSEEIKQFTKSLNSTKTNINLEADKSSSLSITKENPQLSGLVDYTSDGGGSIAVKIKGVKRSISTNKSRKEISISQIELAGNNPEQIASILKDLTEGKSRKKASKQHQIELESNRTSQIVSPLKDLTDGKK